METIQIATKEIGVRSDINHAVNPRVLDYFKKIGQPYAPGDDQVWCAAFVGFVLETCGITSTKSLSARSYLKWGNAEQSPKEGDVVVFWRDSVDSANGHVSFFHHQEGDTLYCLGGNQGSGLVDIEGYPTSRVLGYRSAITNNQNSNHMEPTTSTETQEVSAQAPVMEPENVVVTQSTKQVVAVNKIAANVTISVDGGVESNANIDLPVTPEMVAAVQAVEDPTYNITAVASPTAETQI